MAIKLIKKKDKYTYIQNGIKGKEVPKVYPLICDRLTLTCDFPTHIKNIIINNFKQEKAKKYGFYDLSIYLPGLEKAFAPYVENIEGGETNAYIQCGPNVSGIPFLRLNFNPSKLKSLDELSSMIDNSLLTEPEYGFDYVLKEGRIASVDFAVDIARERVNEFLFHYPQIQCCEIVHSKSGRTEYLGTKKSGTRRFRIYDKVPALKEHNSTHWKKVEKEPIPDFDVMRVEVTLRPKCKLDELLKKHGNPFNHLAISSFLSVKPHPKFNKLELSLWDMFLSLSRFEGAQAAMARVSKYQRAKFRKQIEKGISKWWNPEYIWAQSSDIVKQLFES